MNKILFCGYREWALDLYTNLDFHGLHKGFDLARSPKELEFRTSKNKYDIIFFIGWSWIINEELLRSSRCICMHPSPLPKYRGGSPLQNQIINGETEGAVTFFLIDEQIDHGNILWQRSLSLRDKLSSIFTDITTLTAQGIEFILSNPNYQGYEQDHTQATVCKRRKPADSEIKLEDFKNMTATQIYNKVRSLQNPYPNAFVVCKDNTILFLTEGHL